jgi:hypothetical protein
MLYWILKITVISIVEFGKAIRMNAEALCRD